MLYDGVTYITGRFFSASCLLTLTDWLPRLTCQILCLKEKLLDINIPEQQFEKQTQIIDIVVWTHPSKNFTIFGRSKSQHNYGHIGFACILQLKRSTVNQDSNFSVCKRHSLCMLHWPCQHCRIFTLCEIVAWIHRQFVSKLELIRVLVELFPISRLQRASSQSVRAVSLSVRFAPVRNCITSGITSLLDYTV